jgi:hypothetical protein
MLILSILLQRKLHISSGVSINSDSDVMSRVRLNNAWLTVFMDSFPVSDTKLEYGASWRYHPEHVIAAKLLLQLRKAVVLISLYSPTTCKLSDQVATNFHELHLSIPLIISRL